MLSCANLSNKAENTMIQILTDKDAVTSRLGLAQIIPLIEPYFRPNILLYFCDFMLSVIIGNFFLIEATDPSHPLLIKAACIVISSLALFRASAFMHEVFHLDKKLKGSGFIYNLFHGFLHKAPLYNYDSHRYHHAPATYGTIDDPEYERLADQSAFHVLFFYPFIIMAIAPIFLVVRWVLVPFLLPFIGHKARHWIYINASTLVMHIPYVRPEPSEKQIRDWYVQDTGCAIYTLAVAGLIYSGILSITILVAWYFVAYFLCVMNYFRAMLNHRYITGFQVTNHKQQVLDSITYPLSIFNVWFYPVGLGYHALHHMFPQIPYHNMGKVHRILMRELPEDHPYRLTVIDNYAMGVRQLLSKRF